jgi:hypothetical protein
MLDEHGDQWPATFASWVQRLVEAHAARDRTASSVFMNNESTRCVGEELALVVPCGVKLRRNNRAAVAARARPSDASGLGLDSSGTNVS